MTHISNLYTLHLIEVPQNCVHSSGLGHLFLIEGVSRPEDLFRRSSYIITVHLKCLELKLYEWSAEQEINKVTIIAVPDPFMRHETSETILYNVKNSDEGVRSSPVVYLMTLSVLKRDRVKSLFRESVPNVK